MKITNGNNTIKILTDENIIEIYVTNRKEPAIIDLQDYEKIKNYHWINDKGYTQSYFWNGKKEKRFYLHKLIMDLRDSKTMVDHINGNPLDNRKCNLRIVTTQQNNINHKVRKDSKSGVSGVFFDKDKKLWRAVISLNRKHIHLGYFENIDDAIRVRKMAEEKYFGDYRRK